MQIINNVLIMNDGTKFLYSGNHKQFDYLTGKITVSEKSKDIYKENITKRNLFCKKNKILYKHIIFPSKPIILKEKYPELNINSIITNDFLLDNVIYPISSYKKSENPFFISDTHPTPKGSWQVTKYIAKNIFGLTIPEAKFTNSKLKGDLNIMVGNDEYDEYEKFNGLLETPYKVLDVNNYDTITGNNEKIRIIKNPLALTDKRCLIFGDSFFNFNLNEQLSLIFNELIFIRTPNFLYEIVKYINPDVIFSGQVERYIPNTVSDSSYRYPLLHNLISTSLNGSLNKDFSIALNAIFAERTSDDYQRWHSNNSANLLRDSATSIENNNIHKALIYMSDALKFRPNGPLIERKIKEYETIIRKNKE